MPDPVLGHRLFADGVTWSVSLDAAGKQHVVGSDGGRVTGVTRDRPSPASWRQCRGHVNTADNGVAFGAASSGTARPLRDAGGGGGAREIRRAGGKARPGQCDSSACRYATPRSPRTLATAASERVGWVSMKPRIVLASSR